MDSQVEKFTSRTFKLPDDKFHHRENSSEAVIETKRKILAFEVIMQGSSNFTLSTYNLYIGIAKGSFSHSQFTREGALKVTKKN